jgi:hypothetical protein
LNDAVAASMDTLTDRILLRVALSASHLRGVSRRPFVMGRSLTLA